MRNLVIAFSVIIFMFACSNTNHYLAKMEGLEIDSIVADSTLYLTNDSNSPKAEIKINMQYLRGKNANIINQQLIQSGILSSELFLQHDGSKKIKSSVDTFIKNYFQEYRDYNGPLFREDKQNGSFYNCFFRLSTKAQISDKQVLTYILKITKTEDGKHESNQKQVIHFNTTSGKIITLKDIFIEGSETSILDAIIAKLMKEFKTKDLTELRSKGIFGDIQPYIPDNYIFYNGNITFIFEEDQIAPHHFGEINVELKHDEIEKYLK